jgi:hypothetical protein
LEVAVNCRSLRHVWKVFVVEDVSWQQIKRPDCHDEAKKSAAFAGNLIFQSGISTTSCWVFTIDQSCWRLAERIMFSARLEAIIPFEVISAVSAI